MTPPAVGHNKPLNDREKEIQAKVSKHDSIEKRLDVALGEAEKDAHAVLDRFFKEMKAQWMAMVMGEEVGK